MTQEMTIPKLGMTMKEAKITRWLKAEGDWVEKGEIVLVIETEKISYEVEAPASGYLRIVITDQGPYPVGTGVALLASDKKQYGQLKEGKVEEVEKEISMEKVPEEGRTIAIPIETERGVRIKSSPLARKIAKEHGLDLGAIQGTGPGGRIIREDVLMAVETKATPAAAEVEGGLKEIAEQIPIEGMRRIIFERMPESLKTSAQITLTMECDATEMIKLRNSLLKRYEKEDLRISYNDILVKILGLVLMEQPRINSSVEGDQLIIWKSIHVGVAMEIDDGLIVPVLRDANQKMILEIHRELNDLYQRARSHRVLPDEIQGGTFTLSNLGFLDIDAFTPIINQPENAILGVGRIVEKPVILDGQVVSRPTMMLSFTCDHRVIDGAHGARFLKRVKELIQDPFQLIQ
jgi:pyruvate dehydrogenase complex dihydrolipoamide acetyltransferase long form